MAAIFDGLRMNGLMAYAPQLGWALAAVFLAEMTRDFYHVLSHRWAPLQRLHSWHHRAYKKDFSPISTEVYRQAQLYNDVPEAIFMIAVMALAAVLTQILGLWVGVLYSAGFLGSALLRSRGLLSSSDITHEPGVPLSGTPSYWTVNRTYHWRHHFDDTNAYYAGLFPVSDKLLGTALSLKGKTVAVTGASGTMGRALIKALAQAGAKPVALTTSGAQISGAVKTLAWRAGQEQSLQEALRKVDILIINHGVNVMGASSPPAIERSLEVNALSGWRLMETFLQTVDSRTGRATKEVWVNTSEAEVSPAFSPLYEISKRLMGDLVNVRRADAPCIVRKLVLGPFKSELNPYGVMGADAIARCVLFLARRDIRNIIVTINPLTYLLFPIKEIAQTIYFRFFLKGNKQRTADTSITTSSVPRDF